MISKFDNYLLESNEKKTYLQQVINVLSKSKFPLSIDEICDEINTNGEIIIPKTSYRSVSTIVLSHTRGKELTSSARARNKIGRFYFKVISDKPMKYMLLNPDSEIHDGLDDDIDFEDDDEDYDIKPFPYRSRFSDASQIEKELKTKHKEII